MEKVKCSCLSFLCNRGLLHILEVVACVVTIILGAFSPKALQYYWTYCMIIWAFCAILTMIIIVIEMFLLEKLFLASCIHWDDFTTGIAFMGFITTFTCAVLYGVFYLCKTCLWDWLVIILGILSCAFYFLEFVTDKCDPSRSVKYLAACPGIFKILEAYVSCIIFVLLRGYERKPVMIYCVVAYILPFPVIPVVIAMNVMKKVRDCLPFDLVRVELLFLLISALFYITTAIMWPVYTLLQHPRPKNCPTNSCLWNVNFLIAFMTYVNLILFVVELLLTFLRICGFERDS